MQRINLLAQDEAARLGTHFIGPEHYFLALVAQPDCTGARVLERLGLSLDDVGQQVLQQVTAGPGARGQEVQLTPSAERVINLAREEARQLNQFRLDAHHLLLGLIRDGEGLPARVLVKLGVDLYRARRETYRMLVGER